MSDIVFAIYEARKMQCFLAINILRSGGVKTVLWRGLFVVEVRFFGLFSDKMA